MKKQILYSGTFENLDLYPEEVTDTLVIALAARTSRRPFLRLQRKEAGHLVGVPEKELFRQRSGHFEPLRAKLLFR